MKKIFYLLPLVAIALTGCRKTEESFEPGKYNSSNFDDNYYVEWNGLKIKDKDGKDTEELAIKIGNTGVLPLLSKSSRSIYNFDDPGFEVFNLSKEENKFSYGYLSKLYDGKLRCDGKHFTMLRVQLNKTGYGTFFPKEFVTSDSFAFALRGATSIPDSDYNPETKPRVTKVKINAIFKFYVRREGTDIYDQYNLTFNDLEIDSDNHGQTTYVSCLADMDVIRGADAMSFEYSLVDPGVYTHWDVTDDYTVEGKEHFAIMMYEVLFPHSKWY